MKKFIGQLISLALLVFVVFSVSATSPWVATIATIVFWWQSVVLPLVATLILGYLVLDKQGLLQAVDRHPPILNFIGLLLSVAWVGVFLYAGWAWCLFWSFVVFIEILTMQLTPRSKI